MKKLLLLSLITGLLSCAQMPLKKSPTRNPSASKPGQKKRSFLEKLTGRGKVSYEESIKQNIKQKIAEHERREAKKESEQGPKRVSFEILFDSNREVKDTSQSKLYDPYRYVTYEKTKQKKNLIYRFKDRFSPKKKSLVNLFINTQVLPRHRDARRNFDLQIAQVFSKNNNLKKIKDYWKFIFETEVQENAITLNFDSVSQKYSLRNNTHLSNLTVEMFRPLLDAHRSVTKEQALTLSNKKLREYLGSILFSFNEYHDGPTHSFTYKFKFMGEVMIPWVFGQLKNSRENQSEAILNNFKEIISDLVERTPSIHLMELTREHLLPGIIRQGSTENLAAILDALNLAYRPRLDSHNSFTYETLAPARTSTKAVFQ